AKAKDGTIEPKLLHKCTLPLFVDRKHAQIRDHHVDHAGAGEGQSALVQELWLDGAVLGLGAVLHDDAHFLHAGDEVHGSAHAFHHLAGDHPVGEVTVLGDLHRTEQSKVYMPATDHRKGIRR